MACHLPIVPLCAGVSDFLEGRLSEGALPQSSYRIGVASAPLHELYPPPLTHALREG